jgi:phosphohistidine phosphatase
MDPERTLIVLRHAQAAGEPGVADRQRPLTAAGRSDASAAGRWLLAEGLVPDRVLCSAARRARQTWQQVSAALGVVGERALVSFEPRVYEAGAAGLLDLTQECPGETGVLLVVGHNPAVHRLAVNLTGRPDLAFPAGSLAVIGISGSWRDAGPGTAELLKFWRPPPGQA